MPLSGLVICHTIAVEKRAGGKALVGCGAENIGSSAHRTNNAAAGRNRALVTVCTASYAATAILHIATGGTAIHTLSIKEGSVICAGGALIVASSET